MNINTKKCPFCNLEKGRKIIAENDISFSVYDNYPVSKGHVLIIPKRHCSDYFELAPEEQAPCWNLVNKVKKILDDNFKPEGYNIGINVNESAGQTVPHAHIHVIPRYIGDVDNPRGGIRHVIPQKGYY